MPALSTELSESMATVAASGSVDEKSLKLICAWPLSGQYGAGSRVLFYALVAACIVARKYEWLREACLAAVLLLPAVAALHGIVLAAVHHSGAVDMDIYGVFQLCAIGILAAPVTVRLSQTYFDRPGRNAIFLWTGIIVAGLMSLAIEFYRANPRPHDIPGTFEYGEEVEYGMNCSSARSLLRTGSVGNIYVIPEPSILTFGTATLLNAALCVHAILWLLSMLDKILEESSSKYRKGTRPSEQDNEPIEGTNGATRSGMERINEMVRRCLNVVVVPVFMAAGLAVLIIGERNFFSQQMSYQTEPISSVGQWAPIAAASLAVIGSLYLLLAKDMARLEKEQDRTLCACPHCHELEELPSSSALRPRSSGSIVHQMQRSHSQESGRPPSISLGRRRQGTENLSRTTSEAVTIDVGKRRAVAQAFIKASSLLGMAAREWTDDTDFQRGRAQDWPEIPGEPNRNRQLSQIRTQYNKPRDENGNTTPSGPARSQASSFVGSVHDRDDEESPTRSTDRRTLLCASPPGTHETGGLLSVTMNVLPTDSARNLSSSERSTLPGQQGRHVESPNLLEVPRTAFLSTRSAFGD